MPKVKGQRDRQRSKKHMHKRQIELHEPHKKPGMNSGAPEGYFEAKMHGSMH